MNNPRNIRFAIIFSLVTYVFTPLSLVAGGKPQDTADLDEALTIKEFERENGIDVYEVCAACHLLEGWGKPDGTFPQIAGQYPNIIINALKEIRLKNRETPTMYPYTLSRGLGSPQDVADVAFYISGLPMNPDNGKGPGKNLEHGEKLYKKDCVACHGANGEGIQAAGFPRIHGQHFNYLVRQFEWIRDGKRKNVNPAMVQAIEGYNDDEVWAVLDYVSRLKPPKELVAPPGWVNPDYD